VKTLFVWLLIGGSLASDEDGNVGIALKVKREEKARYAVKLGSNSVTIHCGY